jgi:hypothetical protein
VVVYVREMEKYEKTEQGYVLCEWVVDDIIKKKKRFLMQILTPDQPKWNCCYTQKSKKGKEQKKD